MVEYLYYMPSKLECQTNFLLVSNSTMSSNDRAATIPALTVANCASSATHFIYFAFSIQKTPEWEASIPYATYGHTYTQS